MWSPATIMGIVKFAAIAGILTLALVTFRQYQEDQRNLRDSLIEANAEKISSQARAQEFENANRQLEAALGIMEESLKASQIAVEELQKQNALAQAEADKQREVLADVERLQSIANRKTSLLERMSNRATKERFDELSHIFNQTEGDNG